MAELKFLIYALKIQPCFEHRKLYSAFIISIEINALKNILLITVLAIYQALLNP